MVARSYREPHPESDIGIDRPAPSFIPFLPPGRAGVASPMRVESIRERDRFSPSRGPGRSALTVRRTESRFCRGEATDPLESLTL